MGLWNLDEDSFQDLTAPSLTTVPTSYAMVKVGLFDKLQPGDEIRIIIDPRVGGSIGTYVTASKISKIENDPRFNVTSWNFNDDGSVSLYVTIVQPDPQIVQAGISAWVIVLAVIGLVGIAFVSVTTYKVAAVYDDTIDSPAGQAVAYSVPVIAAAILLGVSYLWVKKYA